MVGLPISGLSSWKIDWRKLPFLELLRISGADLFQELATQILTGHSRHLEVWGKPTLRLTRVTCRDKPIP